METVSYKKVAMCYPAYFKVVSKINPWMGGEVDLKLAKEQWTALKDALTNCGIEVIVMEQSPTLPDMVFACNGGLVLGNKAYLAHFRWPERQGERECFRKWFIRNGFQIMGARNAFFEGGGDASFTGGKVLFGGHGFRTEKHAYDVIDEQLLGGTKSGYEVVTLELKNELYYHMDTCYLPLDARTGLYYPPAFTDASIEKMRAHVNLIPVTDEDAKNFICNGLSVPEKRTVILPTGVSDLTRKALAQMEWNVIQVDMSEFMKAGGACQCLVLKLWEEI